MDKQQFWATMTFPGGESKIFVGFFSDWYLAMNSALAQAKMMGSTLKSIYIDSPGGRKKSFLGTL